MLGSDHGVNQFAQVRSHEDIFVGDYLRRQHNDQIVARVIVPVSPGRARPSTSANRGGFGRVISRGIMPKDCRDAEAKTVAW